MMDTLESNNYAVIFHKTCWHCAHLIRIKTKGGWIYQCSKTDEPEQVNTGGICDMYWGGKQQPIIEEV